MTAADLQITQISQKTMSNRIVMVHGYHKKTRRVDVAEVLKRHRCDSHEAAALVREGLPTANAEAFLDGPFCASLKSVRSSGKEYTFSVPEIVALIQQKEREAAEKLARRMQRGKHVLQSISV